jgi:hypothetical protein
VIRCDSTLPNAVPKEANFRSDPPKFPTPNNAAYLSKKPYQPLQEPVNEVRLLRVYPKLLRLEEILTEFPSWSETLGLHLAEFTDREYVACELLPARSLQESNDQYYALSYCAGNPSETGMTTPDSINPSNQLSYIFFLCK